MVTRSRLVSTGAFLLIIGLSAGGESAGGEALAGGRPAGLDRSLRGRMIVVQPGYPGSTRDAEGFMKRLCAYLYAEAGERDGEGRPAALPRVTGPRVTGLSATYHNVPAEALAALEQLSFSCGIVSLGFYLEHREELGIRVLLEASPEGRFYLVASRKGDEDRGRSLVGQPVVGGPLYELEFLRRLAFRDVADVETWKAVPTLKISRGLRKMKRGEYRAAVLNSREYGTLEKLGRLKELDTVHRSDAFPVALFVTIAGFPATKTGTTKPGAGSAPGRKRGPGRKDVDARKRALDRFASRLALVVRDMSKNSVGKEILETMGCDGFRTVRAKRLEELEKRYARKDK
ncbi:MAG: hypothetical protein O7J95_10985 [Planctomycetota bacterium]|nr:hypothetical protein [Planctomycetota bacterium]